MAGVELATAYVSLIVEGSKVAPGVKKSLGGVEGEADRVGKRSGKRLGDGMAKASSGAARRIAAGLAGAFAAAKVVDFLKDSVAEARESQKVGALTAQVIKTTGKAANVTADQVGNLATAISNKTGIDDEAVQSGQNMLLTFKNIRNETGKGNKIFDQASQTLVDMSTALGTDASKSAIQLGKALNDPIKGVTALSRVGVTFTDGQKKQIAQMVKVGDVAGAQKLILKELNSEFGGAAAASATAGEKATTAWNNLKEQIGTALLPTIDRLEGKLSNKIIPAVSKFLTQMQNGKGKGGEFAAKMKSAFSDVKGYINDAYRIGKKFVDVFNSLPGGVKKALVIGVSAGAIGSKIPGAKSAVGLGAKAITKSVTGGVQKVFVVNPGFSGAGGTGGAGGVAGAASKGKGELGKLGKFSALAGLFAAGGMVAGGGGLKTVGPNRRFDGSKRKSITSDNYTDADLARMTHAQKALLGIEDAARQAASGQKNAAAGFSAATRVLNTANPAIGKYGKALHALPKGVRTAIATPGAIRSEADVNRLQKRFELTPAQKSTVMHVAGVDPAISKVRQLQLAIAAVRSKSVTIRTVTVHSKNGAAAVARARGGPVTAGQPYVVGEHRPELFVPNVSGRIIPRVPGASRNGVAGVASGSGRMALTITNWHDGTGHFEAIADSRVDSAASLNAESVRAI